MFRIVFQSRVSIFDLQNSLKNRRNKKLLGFKSYLVDWPVAFYIL